MMMPGIRKNLLAFGLALVIFSAGGVVGAFVAHHHGSTVHDPPPGDADQIHADLLAALRDHLELTDDQARRIGEIMQRTRAAAEEILARERPAMQALHERARAEVRELLNPEQVDEYEKMIEQHQRRMQHGFRPHHGH
jgi:Spy/CpxP family protein refolding chaperone